MSRLTALTGLRTAAVAALAAALCAALVPARAATTSLPMTVANDSGRSEQTYIYVTARNQSTGEQGYVGSDGQWHAFELPSSVPAGQPNPAAPDFAIAGPTDGSSTTLDLPSSLAGGRIYISFGEKLSFYLSPGGLVEPAAWNESDPNHDILFDWAEFTRNGTGIFINTTMVDMSSVPISLSVTDSSGDTTTEGTLVSGGREQIFAEIEALGGDWANLIQTRESDGLPLRVLAPIHGMETESAFSSTFFDSYIDDVYDYYASHTLTVAMDMGTYTGTVNGDSFTFTDSSGATIGSLTRPTTAEVFGCSGALQPGGQPNQTAILAVGARVCAAFHRGTLSTPSRVASDTQPTYDASSFYQTASSDLYSKVMHDASADGRAYGFAFDDVAELSPSIDVSDPVSATLTLSPFTSSGEGDDGGSTGGGDGSDGSSPGAVVNAVNDKCLDVAAASSANGTAVQLYDCNGTVAQQWTFEDGQLKAMGKCLDAAEWGTSDGTPLQIWDCNPGQSNQTWVRFNGGYLNPASGRCVDDPGSSTENGARIQLWACNGTDAQKWTTPGGTL
ncbi:beta-1,3-glucanase family protein [Demequina capsici]|uniref:Beta-1,3-glucanase family protein n=1 Tax=Demequina capsici TaxID=3075620 RepID=A0AA96F4Z5_9MICO|nr:beta-1,3-glucanase family protein [Demequina sp. OYTSA14]WNM24156.1 beta-1,3-glucanase family protein [Demequina sp. OYTSA14]